MRHFYSKALSSAGVVALMVVSGCSISGQKSIKIDGHTFLVPDRYLVKGRIPWLPASQSSGLTFIVNPDAPLNEQFIVRIEATEGRCNPATPSVSNQLSLACQAAQRHETAYPEGELNLKRVVRDDNPTQWEYHLQTEPGAEASAVVASCYGSSQETGLCTSLSNYKDLVYTVGLRDGDVQRLSVIWGDVRKLLSSWEAKAG